MARGLDNRFCAVQYGSADQSASLFTYDAMIISLQVLDQATDVLKTEGVLKGPSSKLEAARRHQKEMELQHAEELAAKNLLDMQREREREEKAERLRETAAAIDRKLAETLLSSDEQQKEMPDDDSDSGGGSRSVNAVARRRWMPPCSHRTELLNLYSCRY